MSADDGPGRREVAYRVFAAEYDDSTVEHKESDEERAPNYVVSPTGARLNRLFAVGVLTEVEQVNEDTKRARVVDPTGAFVVYAGQYQPDAVTALERIDPPAFVAVTGKANTFSPDDSDRVFTSLRPESINEVDADTRDRWVVRTAEHTLARVATMADALGREERGTDLRAALEAEGVEPGVAAGVPLAIDGYGTTPGYLAAMRDLAVDAAEVVADRRDEVRSLSLSPGDRGSESVSLSDLATAAPASGLTDGEGAVAERAAATAEATSGETADEDGSPTTATGSEAGDGEAAATTRSDEDGTPAAGEVEATEPAAPTETETTEATAATTGSDDDTTADPASGSSRSAESEPDDGTATSATAGAGADDTGLDATTDAGAGPDDAAGDSGTAGTDGAADAADGPGDDGDLGDFEPGELSADTDDMYEFDEAEREQIKEEHDVSFSTGTEVSDPGEADVETPAAGGETVADDTTVSGEDVGADESPTGDDEAAEAGGADAQEGAVEADAAADIDADADADAAEDADAGSEVDAAEDADAETDTAADVDAEPGDVLLDVMAELDDGGGAPRDELVATVADRTGASEADVEDAIQDALMGGQCYESGEDHLTPI